MLPRTDGGVPLAWPYRLSLLARTPAPLALGGVVPDTEQTTLPKICSVVPGEMHGDKMQDLEKMAAKLLETARKLPPGAEQHALLEQIRTFRITLSAVAAKRKELQSAK
jgi:hypothetical protein